jgi:hypothetical protein
MRRLRSTLAAVVVLTGAASACGRTAAPCVPALLDGPTVAALQAAGHAVTYNGRGVWHLDGAPIAWAPGGEDVTVPACVPADVVPGVDR